MKRADQKDLWRLSALDLAANIRNRSVSAREATTSVLGRMAQVNPRLNALPDEFMEGALAAADAADKTLQRGDPRGPLHGVPVTVSVNVDMAGQATTDGVVAARHNGAGTDSPVVANLRDAGAIIVGRSNTPAFSLRWFTDNDLYGRTLNPFNPHISPGGSSGGAAVAVATGMGPIAHGNDYGGSIRYPAWACGVVGLRPTVGRVPHYQASAPLRSLSHQLMGVQGPLTRTVADARLALEVMARPSALDPGCQRVPLTFSDSNRPFKGLRVALFSKHPGYDVDAAVRVPVVQAAEWLEGAGCRVEEVEPPHFEETAALWRQLVMDDLRQTGLQAIHSWGDAPVRSALAGYLHELPRLGADLLLQALSRRFTLMREWNVFFEQYPVLLMPNSWQVQFPIDADSAPPAQVLKLLQAQAPLLATACLGLPGLTVPTGALDGLPTGVQICTGRFREDMALRAGEVIEKAAGYSVLDELDLLAVR
jgi:amidase